MWTNSGQDERMYKRVADSLEGWTYRLNYIIYNRWNAERMYKMRADCYKWWAYV